MSTATPSHLGLPDAKDQWNAMTQSMGGSEQLALKAVSPTRHWLLLRGWVQALQRFVRHIVMLAAFAMVLAPVQEKARRARTSASSRRAESTDPASWHVRFAMPSPVLLQAAASRRSPGSRASAAAHHDPYREPKSPFAMRKEPPPLWMRRQMAYQKRLKAQARRARPPQAPARAPAAAIARPAAAPFQDAMKLARRIEAIRRTLVNFDAAALRFARSLQRNRLRNAVRPEGARRAFRITPPTPSVETFGDKCLRPLVESIVMAFGEALARFNSS